MHFAGNQALVGSTIYANGLDLCSWVSYSPPYFSDVAHVLRWPLITYRYGINYSSNSTMIIQFVKLLVMEISILAMLLWILVINHWLCKLRQLILSFKTRLLVNNIMNSKHAVLLCIHR